jgi:L-threonylcarbamoyladenylate synthase
MALVAIASVVAGARAGRVISFPTDTVPALAVIPEHREEIFQLKQRSPDKPLILMGASLENLWDFVDVNDPAFPIWQELAQSKLPGALTLVLPQNPNLPLLNEGFNNIGIRIPDHKRAIAVLRQTSPLLTTSANFSGQSPLMTMAAISLQFPQVLALEQSTQIMDQVITGQPSTVIEWTKTGWVVKRQGLVKIN